MSNYGYGNGQPNRYDQRGDAPPQAPYPTGNQGYDSYGAQPQYGNQQRDYTPPPRQYGRQQRNDEVSMGHDGYNGNGRAVEMEHLNPVQHDQGQSDPSNNTVILDECEQIIAEIGSFRKSTLENLRRSQAAVLSDPDTSTNSRSAEDHRQCSSAALAQFRLLTSKAKAVKSRPTSPSTARFVKPHIARMSKALGDALNAMQQLESQYNRGAQDQAKRQYRIVLPNASEQEIEAAVEGGSNQQVFSNATLQASRSADSRSVMSSVQSRNQEIKRIESQMIELAQMFQQMNELVVQQEEAVTNIEMKGEEVVENMHKGTAEIGVAVKSARNARKWKWWCLGISVIIIIIIVVVVLLYQFVFGPGAKSNRDATQAKKRFAIPEGLSTAALKPSAPLKPRADFNLPGLEWTPDNTLVRISKPFRA